MSFQDFYENNLKKITWRTGGEGSALCPFHDDKRTSLSVNKDKGLWYCHACNDGGTASQFALRLGIDAPSRREQDPDAIYYYHNKEGKSIYRIVRGRDKKFYAERPNGKGSWEKGIKGISLVPYRLPEVMKAEGFVYIVEGEKDVETLRKQGMSATTNPFGAGKWKDEFSDYLRDMNVIILPDNDQPGKEHGRRVSESLMGKANRALIVELPGLGDKEDVTDWLNKGHTVKELSDYVIKLWDEAANNKKITPPASTISQPSSTPSEETKTPAAPTDIPFPKDAWVGVFKDYLEIVGHCTEAPNEYHWATLFLQLGLAIGRKAWIKNPSRVYSNTFVLLVGPSGRNKKSTCLSFGERLSKLMEDDHTVIRHPASLEGIYQGLAKKPETKALIFQDEFKGLLAAAHRSTTSNLLTGLHQLYTCPDRDCITRRETTTIEKPFTSLLTGAPQRWLEEEFEPGDFAGGFMSRVMIFRGKRKPPIPRPASPDSQRLQELAGKIKEMSAALPAGGSCLRWSDEAGSLFDRWYFDNQRIMDRLSEQEGALCVRTHEFIVKIALVYSIIEKEFCITEKAMAIAIQIGDYLQNTALRLFGGVAFTRRGRIEQRIIKALREKALTRREIKHLFGGYCDSKEVNDAVEALQTSEQIQKCTIAREGKRSLEGFRLPEKGGV